mmetsp:Transcript_18317/g.70766  ORF Transcript_18317/g.70766 Transcript_18317/m.70766 type:complete len:345 (+) Transcript_18317:736-1770(+)
MFDGERLEVALRELLHERVAEARKDDADMLGADHEPVEGLHDEFLHVWRHGVEGNERVQLHEGGFLVPLPRNDHLHCNLRVSGQRTAPVHPAERALAQPVHHSVAINEDVAGVEEEMAVGVVEVRLGTVDEVASGGLGIVHDSGAAVSLGVGGPDKLLLLLCAGGGGQGGGGGGGSAPGRQRQAAAGGRAAHGLQRVGGRQRVHVHPEPLLAAGRDAAVVAALRLRAGLPARRPAAARPGPRLCPPARAPRGPRPAPLPLCLAAAALALALSACLPAGVLLGGGGPEAVAVLLATPPRPLRALPLLMLALLQRSLPLARALHLLLGAHARPSLLLCSCTCGRLS